MTDLQHIDLYRKKPKQGRSEYSISLIFEAAAQILQEERQENFNTNAIAQAAGVSVGTLYQYFPNKNAILLAMAKQELEKVCAQIIRTLKEKKVNDDVIFAQTIIKHLLQAFGGRQKMRKILLEALIINGLFSELMKPTETVIKQIMLLRAELSGKLFTLAPLKLYIMTHSIVGVIRSAVLEESTYLSDKEFAAELVDLLLFFLSDRTNKEKLCQ